MSQEGGLSVGGARQGEVHLSVAASKAFWKKRKKKLMRDAVIYDK